MRRIVICDDEGSWLDNGEQILRRFLDNEEEQYEIICGESIQSLMDRLSEPPDLWFMDIELTKGNPDGIKGMEVINSHYPNCRTVYLTNYLQYAVDVYHTEHMWYVLKEQFEDRLPEIFQKLKAIDKEETSSMTITTTEGDIIKLPVSKIRYLERAGRHTEIITTEGVYCIREKISDSLKMLPQSMFSRCHNSIIVAFPYVKQIRRETILLDDDTELPASRSYRRSFRLKYVQWSRDHTV